MEAAFRAHGERIAAVIVEPVVGNMGCVPPRPGFLEALREITARHGALLIFDEVMTGFRVAFGGAQQRYGILPDLTTLGKVIGGGLPVGAYGGRRDIMRHVAPAGPVYQAGTLSGNPLAVAAGLAMLRYLKAHPEIYSELEATSAAIAAAAPVGITVNRVGAMFTLFFTDQPVTDWDSAKTRGHGGDSRCSFAACWSKASTCRLRNLKLRSFPPRTRTRTSARPGRPREQLLEPQMDTDEHGSCGAGPAAF